MSRPGGAVSAEYSWARVRKVRFQEKILDGEPWVGAKLSSESELVEVLGVSLGSVAGQQPHRAPRPATD